MQLVKRFNDFSMYIIESFYAFQGVFRQGKSGQEIHVVEKPVLIMDINGYFQREKILIIALVFSQYKRLLSNRMRNRSL